MKPIVIKMAKWVLGAFFLLFLIGVVPEQAFRIYFDSKKPAGDQSYKIGKKGNPFNTHATDYFYEIYDGLFLEMESHDLLFEQAEDIDNFDSIPLIIITSTYPNGIDMINDSLLEVE